MSDNSEKKEQEQFTADHIRGLNDNLIKGDLIAPDKIYMDLGLLRDFRLGALLVLAFEKSEEEARRVYGHIIDKRSDYAKRAFLDMEHCYPEAGITNDEIDSVLKNPDYSDKILTASPVTSFLSVFASQMVVNVNHSAVMRKYDPVRVTINTYPLVLSKEWARLVGVFMAQNFGIETVVLSFDPTHASLKMMGAFDEYYLLNLREFSYNKEIHNALSNMEFQEKRIYAAQFLGPRVDPHLSEELVAREFVKIETTFDVVVDSFKFIPPEKCSPPTEVRPTSSKSDSPSDG